MNKLTFEQLPAAVALLLEKIERIEKLLSSNDGQDQFELLDVEKAAEFFHPNLPSTQRFAEANYQAIKPAEDYTSKKMNFKDGW